MFSFDTGNADCEIKKLLWIRNILMSLLEQNGNTVYFPTSDADPGSTQ